MEMTCREALSAVDGQLLVAGDLDSNIRRVLIDSRKIEQNDFFVPLRGERTDGHQFLAAVAQKGAIGSFALVTAASSMPTGMAVIGVADTLSALQRLSFVYRHKFSLPVVGITGSVGKTTTKDMIAAVLSARFKTLKTEGNLNNEIGLPLMLTRLDSSVQVAVLEMGMSGYGEIDLLARLAQPHIGVITNIGESHLEMLGSREGIAGAKCELLPHLPTAGTAVVNGDEPLLEPYLQRLHCKVITFGFSPTATIRCTAITQRDHSKQVVVEQDGYPLLRVTPPLPGRHNIYNLMATVAVARLLDLSNEEIITGFVGIQLSGMRLEVSQTATGINVINDAYNASPTSMTAAIDVLMEKAGNAGKIAVLGDMLELGNLEAEGHGRVGKLVAQQGVNVLLVLGNRAAMIAQGARDAGYPKDQIYICDSHQHAAEIIKQVARAGDWVLLKGSRGMRMEEVQRALSEG